MRFLALSHLPSTQASQRALQVTIYFFLLELIKSLEPFEKPLHGPTSVECIGAEGP